MWSFKRIFKEAFDTGGLLILGIGCLFLFRHQNYPNVLGPLSIGMISVGAFGFVRHAIKELDPSPENAKYDEIIHMFEQRQKANRCLNEKLRASCLRFMVMREILEGLQGHPALTAERATIVAKKFEQQDLATSRESTPITPIDIEPLDGGNPRVTENTAYISVMKLHVPQEQFVEALKVDPTFLPNRATYIAEIYQQDVTTSRESTQETLNNVQLESLSGGSLRGAENRALSKVFAAIKIDVKQQKILEALQRNPSTIEKRAFILSEIKQCDVASSRECTKDTSSDVKFDSLVEEIPRLSENRALSENVGVMELDVQKGQTGKTPKTLIEQALQVQSNISASVQCCATEYHQREDTEKRYLKITEESKQDDPENICEKVTEMDIIKPDKDMKEVGKTREDAVKCNVEGTETLSKTDVQPEELQKEELDKLYTQEQRSEDIVHAEIQMVKEKSEEKLPKEVDQIIPEI